MRQRVIVDTGPLVAFINRREQLHKWVNAELATINQPLLTCEAVITEACFLLRNVYGGEEALISLLETGKIQIPFHLDEETAAVKELLVRYQSVPMSLADACLVRIAELSAESAVFTLDSDFRIYRKNKNQLLAIIMPDDL
ncbi:pilus assembly protein [Chroococcidiopsis sp. CCALA 051]|uniref:type II toxin-antitoxin system VapC family toxin n=1 Tax=Chroococcidiopsis sp. CCALA 051 TaxID=869949 RepID=UPI000D0D7F89|nr:PIN domain-containing protein [Chroococcidiopsis sp. CCALA 051]MBE9017317.1 PIN domain-containing protein [Chroococcidiopsidales cyanobacterium LEGE 13417]PSM48448.1 pilus assembly protein [Chroococcidiopsis sp. CCALA 051]